MKEGNTMKITFKKLLTNVALKVQQWSRLSVWFDHSEGTWRIENDYIKRQRRLFKDHKLVAKIWINRGLRSKLNGLY